MVTCRCGAVLASEPQTSYRCRRCKRVMNSDLQVIATQPLARPTSLAERRYDRAVEAPRRAGRDPVWESLLAQALAESHARQAQVGAV